MSQLSEYLDYVYEQVQSFDPSAGLRCKTDGLWRCVGVFKTGEMSVVYVASEDGHAVAGAIICSNSFCGVRGTITDEQLDFVRALHEDLTIERDNTLA